MQQKIGLWPLTSLVTGSLVGSGVFLLPATLAPFGTVSLLGWILTSIGAILLAFVFAELASRYNTKNGGPYVYAREAFGKDVGYFICWGYWTLSWIGNSALVVGAVSYLGVIYGEFDKSTALILELSILFAVMSFNLMSIKTTGMGELIITVVKVVPLLILPIIGLAYIDLANFSTLNPSGKPFMESLNSVAFLTLWAYIGLETGTVPSGQVINAKKNVPLAIIFGTLIAAAVYVLGTAVVMGVVPHDQLVKSKAPYADAAAIIFGGSWGIPVAVTAIISCIGTLNAWTLVVGRIPQGAAEDGLFPKIFKKVNKAGTPQFGIVVSSLLSVPFIIMSLEENLTAQFNTIIDIAVSSILIVYVVCVLAYFKLLIKANALTGVKFLIGSLALIFSLWTLWAASLKMVCLSIILYVLGVPMYMMMKLRKK